MSSGQSDSSRRAFLRRAGLVTAGGATGYFVSGNTPLQKRIAEVLRALPGMGFQGESVSLGRRFDAQTLLAAPGDRPGYWVGAPAIAYDRVADRLLVHVRHRTPQKRGYRVSLYRLDRETMALERLVSVEKSDVGARSMEGGAIIPSRGEYRWVISYQSATGGDWRLQHRSSSSIEGLASGGTDLAVSSAFYHRKDPAYVDGTLYASSYSRNWLDTGIERVAFDETPASSERVAVSGVDNARVTGGGVVGDEVFVDAWPDVPGTDLPNLAWTTDERSYTAVRSPGQIAVDASWHAVSRCRRSLKYLDATAVGDTVYVLWQAETCDGSNDLVGARVDVDRYRATVLP